MRLGRLDPASVLNANIKIGSSVMMLAAIGQVSAKGVNSCVVSPFDSMHLDVMERSLKLWDDSLDIKRSENMLILTQVAQGKEGKTKMVQKLKKLANDRKEDLKKMRTKMNDELKKYKKIIPEDRFRTIESEAKALFDKSIENVDKM